MPPGVQKVFSGTGNVPFLTRMVVIWINSPLHCTYIFYTALVHTDAHEFVCVSAKARSSNELLKGRFAEYVMEKSELPEKYILDIYSRY